ncbi:MAG: hypothetical protein HQL74_07255 [Magnetococcales bacterium]|nr:hypothetical protein [Magnetococcales bacterium]
MSSCQCRQIEHVAELAKTFPTAWKELENFHLNNGRDGLPSWPKWCFAPLAAGVAVASQSHAIPAAEMVASIIVGVGTWRMTKGIYSVDPAVRQALMSTPLTGALPIDIFYHLPEWCVYIEIPDHPVMGMSLQGAYVWLEWDANTGRHELRLLLDGDELIPMVLHLIPGATIEECLQAAVDVALSNAMARGLEAGFHLQEITDTISPILSLVMYLCSDEPDVVYRPEPAARPGNPTPRKIKKGMKIFAAENPRVWDVGSKIGGAIRAARERHPSAESQPGQSPAPHIRRAHWHAYWVGKHGSQERRVILKWIHPIFVGGVAD